MTADKREQGATRLHVVIIGGGFGGLEAARGLARAPVDVTLIDRRNHHLFQPLLYQVATAGLNPGDIAYPIRHILRRQRNARVLLAGAQAVDVAAREVHTDGGPLYYDYLVVATGATHSYFGQDHWAEHAPGLKTLEDALDIRRRVFLAYEAAERSGDRAEQLAFQTFVVIGAGPTGVELAGALAEIGRHTLARDFRTIDPTEVRVVLIEGQERVLPGYPEDLSDRAREQLERLGVEVRTGCLVTGIDAGGAQIGDTRIEARTALWAAGVRGSSLARTLDAPLDRNGRVEVQGDLSLPDHPEVFVVGDLARCLQGESGEVPGVAQGAIQGGRHAAAMIRADLASVARRPFRYRDLGSMASIGRNRAVADLGRWHSSGFFAWLFWWVAHVLFLVGFRNRFLVMFGWIWSYLTYQRGARLITGKVPPLPGLGGRRGQ